MFVVTANPSFTHVVKVRVPIDGGFADQSFKATFEVMPTDEAKQFDLSDGEASGAFLRKVLINMDDLVDGQNQQVPYSDAIRDQLLGLQYVRAALARTYFEGVSGASLGN